VLGREADILFITEVVRNSDTAVLWRGDTLSARELADDTVEEVVTVPVGGYAASGTEVYIQLRPVLTHTVEVDAGTGFLFMEESASGLARRVKWMTDEGTATGSALLAVEARPNPASQTTELRIEARDAGVVSITLYNLVGQPMKTVPSIELRGGGVHHQLLDLGELPPGTYLLVAQQGAHKATTKVTVVER